MSEFKTISDKLRAAEKKIAEYYKAADNLQFESGLGVDKFEKLMQVYNAAIKSFDTLAADLKMASDKQKAEIINHKNFTTKKIFK